MLNLGFNLWQRQGVAAPPSNYSLSFDGVNGYVSAPDTALPNGMTDLSFTLWLKTSVTTPDLYALSWGTAGPGSFVSLGIDFGGGGPFVIVDTLGLSTAPTNYADGAWHCVQFVYTDAVPQWDLYVDGNHTTATDHGNIAINNGDGFNLGRSSVDAGKYLQCKIYKPTIYTYALDGDQLAALRDPAQDGVSLGYSPTLYYPFSEGSGSTCADGSGNGIDGALNGGVTWSVDHP